MLKYMNDSFVSKKEESLDSYTKFVDDVVNNYGCVCYYVFPSLLNLRTNIESPRSHYILYQQLSIFYDLVFEVMLNACHN